MSNTTNCKKIKKYKEDPLEMEVLRFIELGKSAIFFHDLFQFHQEKYIRLMSELRHGNFSVMVKKKFQLDGQMQTSEMDLFSM